MQLFQLDKFCLKKEIESFSYTINEEQSKFSVNSSYIEGDHRIKRNKTNKVVLKCTGIVKSQHCLHYLRALSEKDDGNGDIKCYFIEKYHEFNPLYESISNENDATNTPYTYRVFFNYCHIDIIATNPRNDCDSIAYDIEFEISLWHNNNFAITQESNAFIVNREKYGQLDIRYDQNYLYDGNNRYDQFISSLVQDSTTLLDNKQNLTNLYKSVTCCDKNTYLYIFFFDRIVKPFISENLYPGSGLIRKGIANVPFNGNQDNFLQFWITNPRSALRRPVAKTYTNQTSFTQDKFAPDNLAGDEPLSIGNLNIISNTYTSNAIIQLFRTQYTISGTPNFYAPTSGVAALNLFEQLNQSYTIAVSNSSNLKIKAKSQFLVDNIKMIIIHPHTQKVYGILGTITPNWNLNNFDFIANTNFVDLEKYILKGDLTITSEIIGQNNWLSFSPRYKADIFSDNQNNVLTFSTEMTSPDIQANSGVCLQIITYPENKLI
jgi:hypothetical protein